eukprot:TRINITY_DN3248_c0_g1_i1.p1 TRINITY_DN3248_c0_g1~~TRINITY_DN3248_c0_g1_i1.p1  ORF type:complete len:313 (+),score=57.18 TRINITY_DN3248_c0_g1_i1:68-940(+)
MGLLWPVLALLGLVAPTAGKGSSLGRTRAGGAAYVSSSRSGYSGQSNTYYVGGFRYNSGYRSRRRGVATCTDPVPREGLTKVWVWTQIHLSEPLCTSCGAGKEGGADVVTFEVDAFKEIASHSDCRPPTQVLVLRTCSAPELRELTDEELHNPTLCTQVGHQESSSMARHVGARRLLQAGGPHHIVQFVVGAETVEHGELLEFAVRTAFNDPDNGLRSIYHLANDSVLDVTAQDSDSGGGSYLFDAVSDFAAECFVCIVGIVLYALCPGCCSSQPDQRRRSHTRPTTVSV